MKIEVKKMGYSRVFSLGNYENEKISVEAEIPEGMSTTQAYIDLKQVVENAHYLRNEIKKYNRACEILNNPKYYTGNDVELAQQDKVIFEKKYPDITSLATHALTEKIEDLGTDE